MATLTMNKALNGIEVKFESKPNRATLDTLKSNGFRWHNVKKLWYAKNTSERLEVAKAITDGKEVKAKAESKPKEKANKYGIKVGDLFVAVWGYEQTNASFFQVVSVCGESSIRVVEVIPEIKEENPVSWGAADRSYKIPEKILPAKDYSVFVKNQDKGDLHRVKDDLGYVYFTIGSSRELVRPYKGETISESWYY